MMLKSVNVKPISSVEELYKTVWGSGSFGIEINFEVIRNKKNINFKVKTVDRMDYFIKNQSY